MNDWTIEQKHMIFGRYRGECISHLFKNITHTDKRSVSSRLQMDNDENEIKKWYAVLKCRSGFGIQYVFKCIQCCIYKIALQYKLYV